MEADPLESDDSSLLDEYYGSSSDQQVLGLGFSNLHNLDDSFYAFRRADGAGWYVVDFVIDSDKEWTGTIEILGDMPASCSSTDLSLPPCLSLEDDNGGWRNLRFLAAASPWEGTGESIRFEPLSDECLSGTCPFAEAFAGVASDNIRAYDYGVRVRMDQGFDLLRVFFIAPEGVRDLGFRVSPE